VGKAKGKCRGKEGAGCPEEGRWSQADECSYAEETVGDDEGTVGREEKSRVV
jgi:hypothetical protein